MESIRKKKVEFALNFTGKKTKLLTRVQRIINPESFKHSKLERGLLSGLLIFAISGMILFSNLANSKNREAFRLSDNANFLVVESGPDEISEEPSVGLSLQEKKESTKRLTVDPKVNNVLAVPKLTQLISDTIMETRDEIEIQKKAVNDALADIKLSHTVISEKEIEELKISLKELESIDETIEEELLKAKVEMEKEYKNLEKLNHFKEIVDNPTLSDEQRKELRSTIKGSIENVNSEEFRQNIRENLNAPLEKMKSGEFKKNVQIQKGIIKELIEKLEVEVFQNKLKGKSDPTQNKKQRVKIKGKTKNPPLYILNGEVMSGKRSVHDIDPNNIKSIEILKGKEAKNKYGKKGKNGVVEIITKQQK